ncbi:MAG: N-acetylmuramoyl-L-alanine amidase [Phycisphaeraceae bacterium]|nr:MAG: N-acetylmuramoyl-L-alanine amidase [Phycisphaeraceae bacterium]
MFLTIPFFPPRVAPLHSQTHLLSSPLPSLADPFAVTTPDHTPDRLSRREALLRTGAGLLSIAALMTGCAGSTRRADSGLPDPIWPASSRPGTTSGPAYTPPPVVTRPDPFTPAPSYDIPAEVIARSAWARGEPVPALMDRQSPISCITLHHDGMTAFTSTDRSAAAARIEAIRAAHRSRNWGDIGYHYIIDPAGRVWQGRPLNWQGAHVAGQNPGNLGICVLGNYDLQRPNQAQLSTVENFVTQQMQRYRINVRRVYTHRELDATACPGQHLQPRFVAMRSPGGVLAMV